MCRQYNWPYLLPLRRWKFARMESSARFTLSGGMVSLKFYRLFCYKGVILWLRQKTRK